MENRKTIFDYLGQTLMVFGVTILILNLLCYICGEDAKEFSTIFQLGKDGLALSTMLQFFTAAVLITIVRLLFFTDVIFKKISIASRTICMLLTVIVLIGIFAYLFGWFPVDMWQAWVGFFVSFFLCFVVSAIISIKKEKLENQALETALKKLQEKEVKE